MKTHLTRSLFALLLLIVAHPAYADSADEKRFEKLGFKYAVPITDAQDFSQKLKPKSGCVCLQNPLAGRLGLLAYDEPSDIVGCIIPGFTDGDYDDFEVCPGIWQILSR